MPFLVKTVDCWAVKSVRTTGFDASMRWFLRVFASFEGVAADGRIADGAIDRCLRVSVALESDLPSTQMHRFVAFRNENAGEKMPAPPDWRILRQAGSTRSCESVTRK